MTWPRIFANPFKPKLAELRLVRVEECGVVFETGVPVAFGFVHNTEKAPYLGSRFQQDIEPAGRYVQHDCGFSRDLSAGWVRGTARFSSPIVLSFSDPVDELEPLYGPHSWKAALAKHFKAKGKALTRALRRAGYDGIVTAWCPARGSCSTREIVQLVLAEVIVEMTKPLTIDMVGQKIGKLTVISVAKRTGRTPGTHWLCRCECGHERVVVGSWLRRAEKLGHAITCDACRKHSVRVAVDDELDDDGDKPRRWGRRCKESKWCQLCAGLSHRVEGESCVECGLTYKPEKTIRAEDTPQHRYRD